jgi:hypothetical protein
MAYGQMLGALTTTTLGQSRAHARRERRGRRRHRGLRAGAIAALQVGRVGR